MKRKLIPPFWMLLAGAVSSLIMYSLHYETKNMLTILLGVLIVFYMVGCLFKWMLDLFDRQNMPIVEEKETVSEDELAEAMAGMDEGQVDVES